jgi:cytochrome oxidase Cu insertion factor (SCO1/SenC/PrrC family)
MQGNGRCSKKPFNSAGTNLTPPASNLEMRRQRNISAARFFGLLMAFALVGLLALVMETPVSSEAGARKTNPLRNYKFTNELGQGVSLSDFHGQALAMTFFFTRCPMPNFCPRLSKNFQEASQILAAKKGLPTNWHFLSVTFDPGNDTPAVLKEYAERYHYDPRHWSFLTGPKDKINQLAALAGVTTEADGALINHNFRTLIIDASNRLQMVFPTSGNFSDSIVSEMLKAIAVTNKPATPAPPK